MKAAFDDTAKPRPSNRDTLSNNQKRNGILLSTHHNKSHGTGESTKEASANGKHVLEGASQLYANNVVSHSQLESRCRQQFLHQLSQ